MILHLRWSLEVRYDDSPSVLVVSVRLCVTPLLYWGQRITAAAATVCVSVFLCEGVRLRSALKVFFGVLTRPTLFLSECRKNRVFQCAPSGEV